MPLSLGLDLSLGAGRGGGFGFNVPGLPLWSAAVRNMLADSADARVIFIGDSTTLGNLSGAASGQLNQFSFPSVFAGLVPEGKGSRSSFVGTQHGSSPVVTETTNIDNRFTFDAAWLSTASGGLSSAVLGGWSFLSHSGLGDADLNFTPGTSWDTVELYYPTGASLGAMNVLHSGSTFILQVSQTGADGFSKSTLTKTLGSASCNIRWAVDGAINLSGAVFRNSASKEVTVLNAGWGGRTAVDVGNDASTPWQTISSLDVYDPDLVVINLGINDWLLGTPTSEVNFKAAMQRIIDAATGAGADVVLMVPVPSSTAVVADAVQEDFHTYILELADTNDCPVVDMFARWIDFATANANGFMFDTVHPSVAGHADMAQAVFETVWDS